MVEGPETNPKVTENEGVRAVKAVEYKQEGGTEWKKL